MTHPVHTPGPAQLPTGFESVKPDEHEGLPLFADADPFNAIAFVVPRKECNANARLLAAAYNAFDSAARKLNLDAVELAERMADGGIAELVIALDMALPFLQPPVEMIPTCVRGDHASLAHGKTEAILTKVKGGEA